MNLDNHLINEAYNGKDLMKYAQRYITPRMLIDRTLKVIEDIIEGEYYEKEEVAASCAAGEIRDAAGFFTSHIVVDDITSRLLGDALLDISEHLKLDPTTLSPEELDKIQEFVQGVQKQAIPLITSLATKQFKTVEADKNAINELENVIIARRHYKTGHVHFTDPDFSSN